MQMHARPAIDRHLIFLAVQGEAPVGNPVDAAPDRRPDIGAIIHVALERSEAQHHAPLVAAHWHDEIAQGRAVAQDLRLTAASAGDAQFLDGLVFEFSDFADRHDGSYNATCSLSGITE
jgi:hypothetical protein